MPTDPTPFKRKRSRPVQVADAIKSWVVEQGLQPGDRLLEDARKAADLLFILTVVFSFISLVIMFVAAVNIMHTFLTLVTERRYEIGIMRAVGATRGDIRKLFLLEAGRDQMVTEQVVGLDLD